jgi:hypothetical protein
LMRGQQERAGSLFSSVSIEDRIPACHPLRRIRKRADQSLDRLTPTFAQLYASEGRPSVPPERLQLGTPAWAARKSMPCLRRFGLAFGGIERKVQYILNRSLWPASTTMKTTAYFRDVVRQKHPGIEAAWMLRVVAEPLEERRQIDGRFALWGLVPEAQNRVLRFISLDDRETIHTTPSWTGASSGPAPAPCHVHLLRRPRHENSLLPGYRHPLH